LARLSTTERHATVPQTFSQVRSLSSRYGANGSKTSWFGTATLGAGITDFEIYRSERQRHTRERPVRGVSSPLPATPRRRVSLGGSPSGKRNFRRAQANIPVCRNVGTEKAAAARRLTEMSRESRLGRTH
jgi:hypothetical protein